MRKKNRESLEAVTHTHTHTFNLWKKKTEQWWNPSTRQRESHFTKMHKKKIK